VARLAGVSVPTVSRVLTGAARVSPERRRRVQEAIEELDYRPNRTARALVSGKADVIGVLTSRTAIHGYSMTLSGIENAARTAGYLVVISVVETREPGEVERVVEHVLGQTLAGVIVLNFDPIGVAVLEALPRHLAVVAVSGEVTGEHPQALLDEAAAAAELVTHLLELGHPTVHHVTVPPSRAEDSRTTGWRAALEAAGAPVPALIPAPSFDATDAVAIGAALARREDVSAVFCGNDEVAMGVITGLFDSGVRVPQDVSVVGFDDHPLARVWRPALTTVFQDFQDLGRRAFALLEDRLAGDLRATRSVVRPPLVVRDSAGAAARPAAGGADVLRPDAPAAPRRPRRGRLA